MLPRSHANIGKIDVRGALEQSSNLYFSYLASEHIENPELLEQAAKNFGYGTKTGLELQGEIAGNIPKDLSDR
jgi:cell division protein FtsI/penicillin-binding protein 2